MEIKECDYTNMAPPENKEAVEIVYDEHEVGHEVIYGSRHEVVNEAAVHDGHEAVCGDNKVVYVNTESAP